MKIELETNNMTDTDLAVLRLLTGGEVVLASAETTVAPEPVKEASAPAKKATPAKAAPKPEPTPEPEAEAEEDLLGGGPTMADAVAAATQLVSSGGAAKVKEALSSVGAKRVSEMKDEDIPAFLAALAA